MTLIIPDTRLTPSAAIDPQTLANSRDYCRNITQCEAKNFYYGLKLLPEPKRSAMYALYAYMRLIDDIADDDSHGRTLDKRKADLDQWEQFTNDAIAAGRGQAKIPPGHILWPAFSDMVARYRVPEKVFADMIAGQRQDLEPVAIDSFSALYAYCYRVASVVGVASLYVWGFDGGDETLQLAVDRGIAFQLTNVLRDLREDSSRRRCYLPRDELDKFNVSADQIAKGELTREFLDLMDFQIKRAQSYYDRSAPLEQKIMPDSRPTLVAMTSIYHAILNKIAAHPRSVLKGRLRLSTWAKLRIGWKAMRGT